LTLQTQLFILKQEKANLQDNVLYKKRKKEIMQLGAFSISLNVKDIQASKEFYEKLGFETMGGVLEQNWLIMKNSDTVIGLFQGMFPQNILTFNPGWDQKASPIGEFTDVRQIQKELKDRGLTLLKEATGYWLY